MFEKNRSIFIYIFLCALLFILTYKIYTSIFSFNNTINSNLLLISRTPESLSQLQGEINSLKNLTDHIEDHSLKDIKKELEKTSRIIDNLVNEFNAQYYSWIKVKSFAEKDKELFIKLKSEVDIVRNTQDNQILKLKEIIDKSQEDSLEELAISYIATFIMGVISSIISSHLYERYIKK